MRWWCVAWSDDIKDKPVAVRVGAEDVVLFRDAARAVQACEDRCAHRRVPLSMGWVTDKGAIQCGYHGWAYNGSTGQCVEIPNFRPDEPISPRVKVRVFPAAEVKGAIFVRLDSTAVADVPALPQFDAFEQGEILADQSELALPHADWIETLIANPFAALGLAFQDAGEHSLSDSGNGSMVMCMAARATDSIAPLAARWEIWARTGFCQLLLRDAAGTTRLHAVISSLALDSDRTLVRWRVYDSRRQGAVTALLLKLRPRGATGMRIHGAALQGVGMQSDQAIQLWRNLPQCGPSSAAQTRTLEER